MSENRTCHNCIWVGDFDVCNLCNGPTDLHVCRWESKTAAPRPATVSLSAPGLLQSAAATMEARGAQYDQAGGERSMGKCVSAFNIITGRDLQESEGWLLLQLLKDVRDRTTPNKPHEDSLIDGVAYAALKAESRLAGK